MTPVKGSNVAVVSWWLAQSRRRKAKRGISKEKEGKRHVGAKEQRTEGVMGEHYINIIIPCLFLDSFFFFFLYLGQDQQPIHSAVLG